MLSPKTKRYISQIIPFGLIWMVFAIIYILVEKGLLGDILYYPSTGNPYDFGGGFFLTIVSSTITGLLLGTFEIRYLNKVFSKRSFSQKLFLKL
jgi:adenylate cyclase